MKLLVVAACCLLGVVGMYGFQAHRQMQLALTRTQDKLALAERTLAQERLARSSVEERLRVATLGCPANGGGRLSKHAHEMPTASRLDAESATSSLERIRSVALREMREALLQASKAAAGAIAVGMPMTAAAVMDAAVPPSSGAPIAAEAAELEAAQYALREALAAEAPGWCSCPPPPNMTLLCSALAPPQVGECEQRVASARAEAQALRSALLEANARVNEVTDSRIEEAVKRAT